MIYLPGFQAIMAYIPTILQEGATQLDRPNSMYGYARLADFVNSAYSDMTQEGIARNKAELIVYTNATLDTDTCKLDYVWTSRRGKPLAVTMRRDADDTTPKFSPPIAEYARAMQGAFTQSQAPWTLDKGAIYMQNRQRHEYWRVWHLYTPAPLFQGTAQNGGSTTTIKFPSSATYGTIYGVTDFYKNSLLRILSGPSAGSEARITAYNATTLIATCESIDGSAAPFSTAPTSASVFSLIPWFPDEWSELLAYRAIQRMTKRGDIADATLPILREKMALWAHFLRTEDQATSDKITHMNSVPTGMMGDGNTGIYMPGTALPYGGLY